MKAVIDEQMSVAVFQYNFKERGSRLIQPTGHSLLDICSNQSTVSNHPVSQSTTHNSYHNPTAPADSLYLQDSLNPTLIFYRTLPCSLYSNYSRLSPSNFQPPITLFPKSCNAPPPFIPLPILSIRGKFKC